jgi:hypothetical protein
MSKFIMSEKNQPIWESYKTLREAEIIAMQEAKGKVNKTGVMVNLAVYHEAACCLDRLCPDFDNLTGDIVRKAKIEKPMRVNHINGFLATLHNEGWVTLSRDVIIEILPIEYRKLIESL